MRGPTPPRGETDPAIGHRLPWGRWMPDLLCVLITTTWGLREAALLWRQRNPESLPWATDAWEYLGFTVHLLDPALAAPSAFR